MIPAIVIAVAALMILVERVRPGRNWRRVPGWWGRAALLNGAQVALVFVGVWTWDRWMSGSRPWRYSGPELAGPWLGYVIITFVFYWWHRARHDLSFLWRWLHQVHHSPQRIEVITSFYKQPIEIMTNGLITSSILFWLVGLDPWASSQAILLTGLAELFYHWNVKTPYWLGFIIQRPESHCVHHQQDHHRQNYADLPLWDMLFGTFHNPRDWDALCGFAGDAERELGALLIGKEPER